MYSFFKGVNMNNISVWAYKKTLAGNTSRFFCPDVNLINKFYFCDFLIKSVSDHAQES